MRNTIGPLFVDILKVTPIVFFAKIIFVDDIL